MQRTSVIGPPNLADRRRNLARDLFDCERYEVLLDPSHKADLALRIAERIAPTAIRRAARGEALIEGVRISLRAVVGLETTAPESELSSLERFADWRLGQLLEAQRLCKQALSLLEEVP